MTKLLSVLFVGVFAVSTLFAASMTQAIYDEEVGYGDDVLEHEFSGVDNKINYGDDVLEHTWTMNDEGPDYGDDVLEHTWTMNDKKPDFGDEDLDSIGA